MGVLGCVDFRACACAAHGRHVSWWVGQLLGCTYKVGQLLGCTYKVGQLLGCTYKVGQLLGCTYKVVQLLGCTYKVGQLLGCTYTATDALKAYGCCMLCAASRQPAVVVVTAGCIMHAHHCCCQAALSGAHVVACVTAARGCWGSGWCKRAGGAAQYKRPADQVRLMCSRADEWHVVSWRACSTLPGRGLSSI
jgi:hypothetical protein